MIEDRTAERIADETLKSFTASAKLAAKSGQADWQAFKDMGIDVPKPLSFKRCFTIAFTQSSNAPTAVCKSFLLRRSSLAAVAILRRRWIDDHSLCVL